MTFQKRVARHDWRSKLTPEEWGVVHDAETRIAHHTKERSAAAALLNPIRNRAIQRCRAEAGE